MAWTPSTEAVQRIARSEVKNLVEYEKVRAQERERIIRAKQSRRVSLGDRLTLLFENRDTVLYQIQEMIRAERIVRDDRIQEEIDAYNALIPGRDELSATLFIEIPDLHLMSPEQVRQAVNRFRGLDRDRVHLVVGPERVGARFEGGFSTTERMAAVQYLRFAVPKPLQQALANSRVPALIVVDHPDYRAQSDLAPEVRRELLTDLAA